MKIKIRVFFVSISLLLICMIATAITASAEEIVPGYPLRWINITSPGYYWTKVNGDLLSSNSVLRNRISSAVDIWLTNSSKSYFTQESF